MAVDAERFRAFERAAHDRMAESYTAFFAPITSLAIETLLDAAGLRAGSSVLDVAAGPGRVAAAAAARGCIARGVDLAPGMVALARKLNPAIAFGEADVEALPFDDGAFDAVVCNFGLGHFPRPEAAVAECVRVLAPGGALALSWWDHPERTRVQGIFREAVAEIAAPPPPELPQGHPLYRFSDAGEFRALLEAAGLASVAIRDRDATCHFADSTTLWQGGLGSFAVTAATIVHGDVTTRDRIRAAFERRAAAYRTPNGLVIPIAFKIGAGRKPM
ncbi:MAG TPA: methyltransferase domain-containing protein [Stellaceae bacterium]|nr:methyltransferase domain-containing protein [Stellaceae bacterium]